MRQKGWSLREFQDNPAYMLCSGEGSFSWKGCKWVTLKVSLVYSAGKSSGLNEMAFEGVRPGPQMERI